MANKAALVTGGGSGLGEATARELADWCAQRLAPMKVPRFVLFTALAVAGAAVALRLGYAPEAAPVVTADFTALTDTGRWDGTRGCDRDGVLDLRAGHEIDVARHAPRRRPGGLADGAPRARSPCVLRGSSLRRE